MGTMKQKPFRHLQTLLCTKSVYNSKENTRRRMNAAQTEEIVYRFGFQCFLQQHLFMYHISVSLCPSCFPNQLPDTLQIQVPSEGSEGNPFGLLRQRATSESSSNPSQSLSTKRTNRHTQWRSTHEETHTHTHTHVLYHYCALLPQMKAQCCLCVKVIPVRVFSDPVLWVNPFGHLQ